MRKKNPKNVDFWNLMWFILIMNISDAKRICEQLLNKDFIVSNRTVNAGSLGYSFEFSNRKKALGDCSYVRRKIRLSTEYVKNNSEQLVRDVMLHELAHAFDKHVFNQWGHSHTWKHVCVCIGAKPNRTTHLVKENVVAPKGSWVIRHKETKEVFADYYRKPTAKIRSVDRLWIPNRFNETYGQLEVVRRW